MLLALGLLAVSCAEEKGTRFNSAKAPETKIGIFGFVRRLIAGWFGTDKEEKPQDAQQSNQRPAQGHELNNSEKPLGSPEGRVYRNALDIAEDQPQQESPNQLSKDLSAIQGGENEEGTTTNNDGFPNDGIPEGVLDPYVRYAEAIMKEEQINLKTAEPEGLLDKGGALEIPT